MKNLTSFSFSFVLLVAAGCGDDKLVTGDTCGTGTHESNGMCVADGNGSGSAITCGAGTMESNGTCVPTTHATTYVQVEHLARPAINEALLITSDFETGYNATAPTFAGVPPATLTAVVNEAKTVLRALYLGTCLLNGVGGFTAINGLHPAGMQCHAVGAAVFMPDGVTQTPESITASKAYADAVFGLFIPDVMRIDTAVTSNYQTFCGGGPVGLCGGRFLNDDSIDVTYDFLLNGVATPKGPYDQVHALVQDGVVFDNVTDANNRDSRIAGDPDNHQQGHPTVSNAFPYSAAPY